MKSSGEARKPNLRRSLLAQRSVNPANYLCLPIKIDDALFDQPGELQITVKLEHLLRGKRRVLGARKLLTFATFRGAYFVLMRISKVLCGALFFRVAIFVSRQ